jgi:hypothetical protein
MIVCPKSVCMRFCHTVRTVGVVSSKLSTRAYRTVCRRVWLLSPSLSCMISPDEFLSYSKATLSSTVGYCTVASFCKFPRRVWLPRLVQFYGGSTTIHRLHCPTVPDSLSTVPMSRLAARASMHVQYIFIICTCVT